MSEILGAEPLYRRVLCGVGHFQPLEDGTVKISSQAFSDRGMKPSVDRSSLCPHGPSYSQADLSDGVVSVLASGVRGIAARSVKDGVTISYAIDVFPDPLPGNPAHAEIRPSPEYATKSAFRKVLEALALLAAWEIYPEEIRSTYQ
ncbi:MAG: hypothetical protein A2289_11710 [Deltaproteobacteria bacterium RIFOXYA12_FULL_58_15]|nr:MAG: hypothetical protein A2289_11710 [Deltaproteobacteria bacterium RIFOXYA12_FULL_58_15]OGR11133.1 MAG: hypothetical protein A2341_12130 [Deltaproteobacteria bacterium RIFOXYB12_FULL_58_9]